MKWCLIMFLMFICIQVQGQNMTLGLRSGISFSNFHSHYSPGEIPEVELTSVDPNKPPVMGGPGSSSQSYLYETNFASDTRIGLYSFIIVDWKIKKKLSVETGVGYSQKGIHMQYHWSSSITKADGNTVNTSYDFNRNLRLDYLVIPLTFRQVLDKRERFYVLGGIYNSLAVKLLIKESLVATHKQTFDTNGSLIESSDSKIWTTAGKANVFDSGLVIGAGVNWPLSEKLFLGIDLRGAVGIINVPAKFQEHGFQGFSSTTKNITIETGAKIQYVFK
jgi:hypothetical protein